MEKEPYLKDNKENIFSKEDQDMLRKIMQRLQYVGKESLSKTQIRKMRREAAEQFFKNAKGYPHWEERIDEIKKYITLTHPFELE